MIKVRRYFLILPALIALLSASAFADSISTYSFDATIGAYYNNVPWPYGGYVYEEITGPQSLNGIFSYDFTTNQLSSWSFDLTPLEGVAEQGTGTFITGAYNNATVQPVDVNGSYQISNQNTVAYTSPGTYFFEFYDYPGDTTAVALNPNYETELTFEVGSLPTGPVPAALVNTGNGLGGLYQFSNNGGTNAYSTYFTGGSVTLLTPEPPSWALLAGGGLLVAGFIFWSDRRRAARA